MPEPLCLPVLKGRQGEFTALADIQPFTRREGRRSDRTWSAVTHHDVDADGVCRTVAAASQVL